MEFRVMRTSARGHQNDTQPCSEAVEVPAWRYEFLIGTQPENIWVVRFETLEELWTFVENYGPCIFGITQYSSQPDGKSMPCIEIEDD